MKRPGSELLSTGSIVTIGKSDKRFKIDSFDPVSNEYCLAKEVERGTFTHVPGTYAKTKAWTIVSTTASQPLPLPPPPPPPRPKAPSKAPTPKAAPPPKTPTPKAAPPPKVPKPKAKAPPPKAPPKPKAPTPKVPEVQPPPPEVPPLAKASASTNRRRAHEGAPMPGTLKEGTIVLLNAKGKRGKVLCYNPISKGYQLAFEDESGAFTVTTEGSEYPRQKAWTVE